ncbi:hypothetical protein ILYODFUR_019337 [Ilyodon furcidens]|uniref:Uncharacterized protein n=1 Tax=Ilyodon furcidens TaxID=33524 RepID=A0ABV0VGU6_9TELE
MNENKQETETLQLRDDLNFDIPVPTSKQWHFTVLQSPSRRNHRARVLTPASPVATNKPSATPAESSAFMPVPMSRKGLQEEQRPPVQVLPCLQCSSITPPNLLQLDGLTLAT